MATQGVCKRVGYQVPCGGGGSCGVGLWVAYGNWEGGGGRMTNLHFKVHNMVLL